MIVNTQHKPIYYSGFGLFIKSELKIGALEPLEIDIETPDISIVYGDVVSHLTSPLVKTTRFQICPDQWLIETDDFCGARLLVSNGHTITVQITGKLVPELLHLVVLGTVITAIHYQRGDLPFHGNTLIGEAGAFMLAGPSGAGKSTLTLALLNRGFKMVADDLSIVSINAGNSVSVRPGIPRLKLWKHTCVENGISIDNLVRLHPFREKYSYDVKHSSALKTCDLKQIFLLSPGDCATPMLTHRISLVDKLSSSERLLSKLSIQEAQAIWPSLFGRLVSMLNCVSVVEVRRPENGSQLNDLVSKIEQNLLVDE